MIHILKGPNFNEFLFRANFVLFITQVYEILYAAGEILRTTISYLANNLFQSSNLYPGNFTYRISIYFVMLGDSRQRQRPVESYRSTLLELEVRIGGVGSRLRRVWNH